MISEPATPTLPTNLGSAYDGSAAERDAGSKEDWKLAERPGLHAAPAHSGSACAYSKLVQVTGQDSLYFSDHGFSVVATDLSAE
jgi:hypothetical protein